MPIYMDIHILPGVKARDVAEAHKKDLHFQEECGCKAMTYRVDEQRGTVFCLVEAPGKMQWKKCIIRCTVLSPTK